MTEALHAIQSSPQDRAGAAILRQRFHTARRHEEYLGSALERREENGISAAHKNLRAEPLELVKQRFASFHVEMRGDFIEQHEGGGAPQICEKLGLSLIHI